MTEAQHEVMTQVMTAMEVDVDEKLDIMAFTCRCPECCPKVPLQEVGSVQTAAGTDPISIPNPKQGGQRTDSLKKRRIVKKTTPSHVSERKKGKCVKNGLKKKAMSAEALAHPITLPVTLVERQGTSTRRAECYLLEATKRFIASQSISFSPNYVENVTQLKAKINSGEIGSTKDARIWLANHR